MLYFEFSKDSVIRDIPAPVPRPYSGYWCFDASVGSHGNIINYIKNFGNTPLVLGNKIRMIDSKENPILIKESGRSFPELVPDQNGVLPGQIGYFITTKTSAKLTGKILSDMQTDESLIKNDSILTFDRLKDW